ncbi:MAG: polysaccharide pyruvyl transferase family protein, partial [Bacteroidales bacterium]|nr:polysaccharide pyruvyl transferase family protein [Bacteroidales bacterium]
QTILFQHGYEPVTFDLGRYTWFDWCKSLLAISYRKLLGQNFRYPKSPIYRSRLESPLRKFVFKRIKLIEPRQIKLNIKCLSSYSFDAYIVGSDQVWRPKYNYDIKNKFLYFLGDSNVKRIAYAASFGTDEWEFSDVQTLECSRLAKKFDAISVRESSGGVLCRDFLGVNSEVVLDPTLLLRTEEYESLCVEIPKRNPFIFSYILDLDDKIVSDIDLFASRKNLPVYYLSAGENIRDSDSVEKWLSYIRDASYIVTDSFHGMCFSIIFNKEFFVYGNENRGNARFNSLLDIFKLNDRYISTLNAEYFNVDWNAVNEILAEQKDRSITWLISELNK